MITRDAIRRMYKENGPVGFVHRFNNMLGLPGPNKHRREWDHSFQRQTFESRKEQPLINTGDVSIKALAQGLISPYDEEIDSALMQGARASSECPLHAMEAGTDIVPSQFANISAYNSAVIGLLEARILEAYRKPTFVLQNAIEHIPSKLRSLKLLGVSNIGDVAQTRDPGQPHARANLSERYVQTPDTTNRGIAIEVTREAALFDYSAQLMKQADGVGDALALRKEYLCIDTVIGVTNTYKYNGTTYNTYQASAADSAGGNYVNSFDNVISTSNAWDAFNNVLQKWMAMTDPETGQPIAIEGFDILAMPQQAMMIEIALQASEITRMANALTGTYFPTDAYKSTNPAKGLFRILGGEYAKTYPYAYKRVTATDGLSLAGNYATKRWWAGDFKKAFHWNENIPLTIVRANVNEYTMGDKGLSLAVFCDEMGAPGVTDPRYVIQNTNSTNA
jgi:hypothetical protein